MLINVLFLQLMFLFTSPVFSSGSKTFRNLVKEEQKLLEMKEDLVKVRSEKKNKQFDDEWKASVKPKSVKDLRHLFMPEYEESQVRHLHEHPLVSCVSSESAWVRIGCIYKLA